MSAAQHRSPFMDELGEGHVGRGHRQLSGVERASLFRLLNWALQNKRLAEFSAVWGSEGPMGEYGIWRWKMPRGRIELSVLTRGVLVRFSRHGDSTVYGFVWNTILREFNDAFVPKRMGRGYFRYILGIDSPKTENDICAQNLRVNFKIFWRSMCSCVRLKATGRRGNAS